MAVVYIILCTFFYTGFYPSFAWNTNSASRRMQDTGVPGGEAKHYIFCKLHSSEPAEALKAFSFIAATGSAGKEEDAACLPVSEKYVEFSFLPSRNASDARSDASYSPAIISMNRKNF